MESGEEILTPLIDRNSPYMACRRKFQRFVRLFYFPTSLVIVVVIILWLSLRTPEISISNILKTNGSSKLTFLSIGDWGRAGTYNQSMLAEQMGIIAKSARPQFIISNGDNFYDEGLRNGDDPFFKSSFSDIYNASSLQVPWFAVLGNHDYYGNVSSQLDPSLTRQDWRWNCIKNGTFSYRISEKDTLSESSVQFFVLDTVPMVKSYRTKEKRALDWSGINTTDFHGYNQQQLKELSHNLECSTARWKIVVGHHPVYSYGSHGDTVELIERLKPILEKYGVDAYMNGHDHTMQHIKKPSSPVHYFTSGGGSKAFKQPGPAMAEGLQFFWEGQGFALVRIGWKSMLVEYYGVFGDLMYSVELRK